MGDRTDQGAGLAIGIDVGDRHSQVCVVDQTGTVIEDARLATTPAAFRRRFSGTERARIAIEAGTHSPWITSLLKECAHEVIVANPRKLRLIYENDSKDDRVDAQYLARIARLDPTLLAPIEHRRREALVDRAVIRARDALVQMRTKLVNTIRGLVKPLGARIPRCSTESFHKQAPAHVPRDLWPAVSALIEQIASLNRAIREYDKQIERAAGRYPETRLLRQVAGVGPVTALAYVVTIDNPRRFKKSRAIGSYLGLRPRKSESGNSDPQLRITKAGDGVLRRLLVQAAHYALGPFGPDSDLRRWGTALAARGGKNAKKRATVAVARKLAVLLHRLWVTAEVYQPLRTAGKGGE